MDPWSLLEPVDILPKLPSTFQADVASKKWLDRKSALESLHSLLNSNPRLDTKVHYNDIVQTLETMLNKDANINVTAMAAKCLTGFARGLRKDYRPHVNSVVPIIFAKFKEKKPLLRDALVECIDAVTAAAPLEAIVDDIMEASQKPNPDIKIQLDLFLYRTIKPLKPNEVPKKFLKEFVPVLVKHTSDSDPEVRNASCAALGAIMKCVGQKATTVLFGDLANDKTKMAKIEENCAKAVQEAAEEEKKLSAETGDANLPENSAKMAHTSALAAASSAAPPQEPEVDSWDLVDPVDITSKMPENFDTDVASKKWLDRKSALESLHTLLNYNPRLEPKAHYDDLVKLLLTLLSKDANINVTAMAAKCLTGIAKGLRKDYRAHVRATVPVIFAKFKEKKPVLRDALIECIDAVAIAAPLEMIVDDIVEASQKPNPDIKIQLDLFLYRTIKSLKPNEVPKKFLKEFTPVLIKHTSDSDPEVRNAACSALGAIMKSVGQKAANVLFGELTGDKIKMAKVEEFYNKAIAGGGGEIESMVQFVHKPDAPKAVEKPKPAAAPAASKEVEKPTEEDDIKVQKPVEEPTSHLERQTGQVRSRRKPESYFAVPNTGPSRIPRLTWPSCHS